MLKFLKAKPILTAGAAISAVIIAAFLFQAYKLQACLRSSKDFEARLALETVKRMKDQSRAYDVIIKEHLQDVEARTRKEQSILSAIQGGEGSIDASVYRAITRLYED